VAEFLDTKKDAEKNEKKAKLRVYGKRGQGERIMLLRAGRRDPGRREG